MVYHDLIDSPAFHALTAKQVQLYIFCLREAHGKATADDPNHDELRFYFNRALQTTVHELYAQTDYRGFERDMAALIRVGFVDCVQSNFKSREKNLYRLSARWHHWGTKAFSLPDSVLSNHMLIERRKEGGGDATEK